MRFYARFYILAGCLLTTLIHAQPAIDDLSFMAGTWRTEHAWGDMEEIWSVPMHNNMIGIYRCIKDGKIIFYETFVVELHADTPVLILRHFSPGSIAWEDKDKPYHCRLVVAGNNKAVFETADGTVRLTYELIAPHELSSVLERKDKDGKLTTDKFVYSRAGH